MDGRKTFITNGGSDEHTLGDAFVVYASTAEREISSFLVEKGMAGFALGQKWKDKLGMRASFTAELVFDGVRVPVANRLGEEGQGTLQMMRNLEVERLTLAAMSLGIAQRSLRVMVDWANQRKTFGVAIGEHQLVKEMIAEMVSDYDAARLLWLRAGWMKNQGLRNTRETSLAKWFATVASERAASDAVQIHGGNGFSDEYPAGRFYRNSKAAVIYEGTREIHKIMQADYLLGYRTDRPTRCTLPAWHEGKAQSSSHKAQVTSSTSQ